jgi:ferric-dicitrate binding protein FerR (iron transport regulator)
MDQETLWILLGKKLNNEATPEELERLDALLAQPWADAYTIQVLEALWKQNPDQPPRFISHKLQEKWDRLEGKLEADESSEIDGLQSPEDKADIQVKNIWPNRTRLSVAAACVAFGILSFFCWKSFTGNNATKTYQIAAPRGGISKIILPDGSKVWLNAGSEIFYGTNYGNKYREIRLTGEAFFDVVKDSEHPFIVNTTTMQIKVLGTAFNVRSYANDNTSETSLIRGRIELTPVSNPDHKIILKPSEKLTLPNNKAGDNGENNTLITLSSLHHEQNDSLPAEAQWLENKLVFDDEYFDEVAKKMERWYNVSISFKNEQLKQKKFSGKFTKESLATALEALKATSNFNFLIDNDKVVIY